MFKDYNDYKTQRDNLIAEAKQMLESGDSEGYKGKVTAVENLDKAWDEYAKEQANIAALEGAVKVPLMTDILSAGSQNDDIAYRKQFMNYVMNKVPMTNETTMSTDAGAVIPQTVLDRIVEKMETTGNILAKVTRTFFKGGVNVPTSSAKPVATWTTESGTSTKQKKAVGSVTFTYYKLKVQIAMSIVVDNVTLDVFERTLISNIAEAMTKAIETAIIKGTGKGQPKGIISETPNEKVEIAAGEKITYDKLCEAEGLLPSGYDGAEWCMKKSTFMTQIMGMTDSTGQPIARINSGINGKPEYSILGRHVEFSEDVPAFAEVESDTVVAFLFRFEDYMLNTNLDVTVTRYTDQDTDDEVTKAIMLVDGKTIDNNSYVPVVLKNA